MANDTPHNQLADLARELDHRDTFSESPSFSPQILLTPDQQRFTSDKRFFERHLGVYSNQTSKPTIFARLWHTLLNWLHDTFPSSQTYGDRNALLNSEMITRALLAFKDPSLVRQTLSENKNFYERQCTDVMDPYDIIVIMMHYPKLTTKLMFEDFKKPPKKTPPKSDMLLTILEFLQEPTTTSKSLKEHLSKRNSLTKPLRPQQKRAFIKQMELLLESSDIPSSTRRLILEKFNRAIGIRHPVRNTSRAAENDIAPEDIITVSPSKAPAHNEPTESIAHNTNNTMSSPIAFLLAQRQTPAKVEQAQIKKENGKTTLQKSLVSAPHAQFFPRRESKNKAIMHLVNATPDELKKMYKDKEAAADKSHGGPPAA